METESTHLHYKDYKSVSVYPYIPREADVEFVLLRETKTGRIFEIAGTTSALDACNLFTAARSLLKHTHGLFTASNLLPSDGTEIKPLVLKKHEHFDSNLILNEPEFSSLLKHMAKAGEHVHVPSDSKVIMFPIGPINLKEFNTYLGKAQAAYELITVPAKTLKDSHDLKFDPSTKEHIDTILSNIFVTIPHVIDASRRKHYAVMTCWDPATTSRMYDHCEYLLQGQFRRQDESWYYFKVALDEYPDLSLLEKLDGKIFSSH